MEILSVTVGKNDDKDRAIRLNAKLEEGEALCEGDVIRIEMKDGTFLEREVKTIDEKVPADSSADSGSAADKGGSGYSLTIMGVTWIKGPCIADLSVTDITPEAVRSKEGSIIQEHPDPFRSMTCITPYKELHCGDLSIYDHIRDGYEVPDRVIAYLYAGTAFCAVAGHFDHPFRPGLGLYAALLTDWKYYWDSNAWKYVVKYHLTLPQEFVDHVMSEEGAECLEHFREDPMSRIDKVEIWKDQKGALCVSIDDALYDQLESF